MKAGRKRGLGGKFCLVVASALLAALLCEAALRLFYPKYQDVAAGQLPPDDMRIYAPAPNTRGWRVHPDTHRRHPHHTNNLGLRQHRNFSDADIASATTVAVFGDSFVHMPIMDAPYVFTEPLDYLLNLDDNSNFAVLNFGVSGYDPAQSYFAYRSFPRREDLDYVLFVHYPENDLKGLVVNGLFDLDDSGRLRQREVRGSAWWVPFASKLHLTYLALDVSGRFAPYVTSLTAERRAEVWRQRKSYFFGSSGGVASEPPTLGPDVFKQLMRRWRMEVEESGGKFFVVPLPTHSINNPRVGPLLKEAGVDVVDLSPCYERPSEGGLDPQYYFDNDGHWNERANRLAAACLNDRLRREAGLPTMTETSRDAALAEYYAAFEPRPRAGFPPRRLGIRRKYQAFAHIQAADLRIESYLSPNNLAVVSNHYDVYVDAAPLQRPESRMRYAVINDLRLIFFHRRAAQCEVPDGLFAYPTPGDGGIYFKEAAHANLFRARMMPLEENGKCMTVLNFHGIPLSHFLVGQRDQTNSPTGPILWSGEIVLDRPAFEKAMEDMLLAAGEPVIESDMDVFVHDKRIFYVADSCHRMDGQTAFILHVTPTHDADLPEHSIEHGYVNLDFHEVGATVGARCVVRWQLPDYPIRHVRTGQYLQIKGSPLLRNLWQGEAAIEG